MKVEKAQQAQSLASSSSNAFTSRLKASDRVKRVRNASPQSAVAAFSPLEGETSRGATISGQATRFLAYATAHAAAAAARCGVLGES